MRSLRAVKYRKKYKKLIILAQLLAIWYAVVLSTAVLTSDTFAFFSDSSQSKMSIQTGTWWDGSDLSFIGEGEELEACVPMDITVKIKNDGFDMIGSTEYEVYYSENGDPKDNGEKVGGGTVDSIKQGENMELVYEDASIGSYIFKLYQRDGYDDNYEERTELWSEKFVINECVMEEEEPEIDEEIEEMEEVAEEDLTQEEEIEIEDEEQPTETKVEDEKTDSEKEKADESNEDNPKENIEEKENEKPKDEQLKKESKEDEKEIEVNKAETKKKTKSEKEEEESESTEEGDE
ncbi:amyloid fiber anchoring/assembly protein TapA [Alkalihalobacillus sp. 1P02AB]|uniref:amyloid fiber anchoring/assembly protein TapA n=1 Tax=Alkalihalobacillus sp. 1P02AB TaxID=3132260 RepID=UPI0039A494CD